MMLMLAVLALAAADPPAAADDPATDVAGLQQMYDQSCAAREYGAYDDLCDQLSQQLKAARVQADHDARRHAAEARRHPAAPAKPPLSVPAQPTPPAPLSAAGPSRPARPG